MEAANEVLEREAEAGTLHERVLEVEVDESEDVEGGGESGKAYIEMVKPKTSLLRTTGADMCLESRTGCVRREEVRS